MVRAANSHRFGRQGTFALRAGTSGLDELGWEAHSSGRARLNGFVLVWKRLAV
jgi:hypothetical protein